MKSLSRALALAIANGCGIPPMEKTDMATSIFIVKTKFFGEVNCTANDQITFPDGMPGFESCHSFVLLDLPRTRPLLFLQSLDDRSLCFAAIPAQQLMDQYAARLSQPDWEHLGLSGEADGAPASDFLQLALVSLDEDEPTANLLAPVVLHVSSRRAVQAIQWNTDYSPRTPLPRSARVA